MPRAHAAAELLNGHPFLVRRAAELGLSPQVLRGPLFRGVCRGVRVCADVPDSPALRLAAARLILPEEAVFSGATAAWLHGIDVTRDPDAALEATFPPGIAVRGRGLFTPRQSSLAPTDVALRRGVRVTSPIRTAYDLARRLELVEAVVVVDAFWHRHQLTPDQLMEYAQAHAGLRGVRQLPRVVDLADAGADSPMESRLRMLMVLEAGLPKPKTQLRVVDRNGRVIANLDTGYEWLRMGAEYDGQVHAQSDVRAKDLRRHNRLLANNWHNLRYDAGAYYHRRDEVIQELRDTYAERSALMSRNDLGLWVPARDA